MATPRRVGTHSPKTRFHCSTACLVVDARPLTVLLVPPDQTWALERAIELYRLWRGREIEASALQPALVVPPTTKPK